MSKRTIPHLRYVEPTRKDIENRFKEIGFEKTYSFDLVQDIANVISHVNEGGSVSDGLKNIRNTLVETDYESTAKFDKAVEYHTNVQKFLLNSNFNSYSGNTPLAKAASVVAALSSENGGKGDENGENGLPIFLDNDSDNIQKIADKLEESVKQTLEASKSLAKYEVNPNYLSPEVALATLNSEQKNFISKLSLLGTRGKIKIQRTAAENKIAQMTEYGQLGNLNSMVSVVLPTFNYKFATKQLLVREPEQSTKQQVIFLIDDSASMDDDEKIAWQRALMVDRLTAVAKGECELYLAWYTNGVDEDNIIKISTKEEALEYLPKHRVANGGATNIEKAVRYVCDGIKNNVLGEHQLKGKKYQIVIINDGNDDVDPEYTPNIMTHAFILGQDNENLQQIVTNSGGHFERFL